MKVVVTAAGGSAAEMEVNAAIKQFDESAGGEALTAELEWPAAAEDPAGVRELLSAADEADGVVRVRFPRLSLQILVDVVFAHPAVELVAPAVSFDTAKPHEIGSLFPMPADPVEYEASRSLSLVSARMQEFIGDLRFVLRSVRRPLTEEPPWDPFDRGLSNLKAEQVGQLVRYVLGSTGSPNLSDVIAAHDSPAVRRDHLRSVDDAESWARQRMGWQLIPQPILLTGESGTGKSLVADLIHAVLFGSNAVRHPLVKVNIGAVDVDNFEHLMFGSAPGFFTGVNYAVGQLVRAAYGTAFLDEIGDLPLAGQTRLLTFLDDRMLTPTGVTPFFGFGQVVAATNRDLAAAVRRRQFKHDLLARFGRRVEIPSLRSRGADEIRCMVDFAAQHPLFNPLEGGRRPVESIAPEAMEKLCAHEYRDGNFRELEMYVHGALLTAWRARRRVIELSDLPIGGRPAFRTDARGAKITVRHLPVTDKVVEVVHADELDWLAERFGEAILVESGRADAERVVVHHGTTYRWCKAAGTS